MLIFHCCGETIFNKTNSFYTVISHKCYTMDYNYVSKVSVYTHNNNGEHYKTLPFRSDISPRSRDKWLGSSRPFYLHRMCPNCLCICNWQNVL